MSQRTAKVESLVQQYVAGNLGELIGPDAARITVTGVDVSPDLRHAIVWLGIIADTKLQHDLFDRVFAMGGELQRIVAANMTTKFAPRLDFRLDTGGAYAADIDRLLKQS